MFVPLKDDNPLRTIHFQYVTVGLIVINFVVFALTSAITEATVASFAIVPGELFGLGPLLPQTVAVPERFTLLTYMFFHGDLLHLGGNMLFLWVFGDNVEDAMGHLRFLVFYLLCGMLAGLAHALVMPGSQLPLIGASGAVAGVIAAYLMLHPRVRVWVLVFKVFPMQISAAIVLGLWALTQLVMVMLPQTDQVAWWAHVGGLAAGALLVIFMRRPGVPLFDRGLSAATRSGVP